MSLLQENKGGVQILIQVSHSVVKHAAVFTLKQSSDKKLCVFSRKTLSWICS